MAVLVIAEVPQQTQEGYDQTLAALMPAMRQAKGFIAHSSAPTDGGWRVFEIWESSEDANQFFATYVHPNLPDGMKPKRSVTKLHSFVSV